MLGCTIGCSQRSLVKKLCCLCLKPCVNAATIHFEISEYLAYFRTKFSEKNQTGTSSLFCVFLYNMY